MAAFAEFESALINERVVAGIRNSKNQKARGDGNQPL
jgi:DNA invertase Pin-like site-specific DNA recombinase